MLAIVNNNVPESVFQILSKYATVISFSTSGITYNEIANHPDIFFCRINYNQLVVAPNLPVHYFKMLRDKKIILIPGTRSIGLKYPYTSHFNAVVTESALIHNLKYTDNEVLKLCSDKKHVAVSQAYTRCNLLPLNDNTFITSDRGIEKVLINQKLNVMYFNPEGIVLPGFKNGFIGGCMGVYKTNVFVIGKLDRYESGNDFNLFVNSLGYNIIELYDGPLFDAGSIIFLEGEQSG